MAELPFGRGRRFATSGVPAADLGGWQLNGLLSAYTGQPFTITAAGTALNAPGSSQFADCLAAPNKLGSTSEWYDKTSFAPVTVARFGTCGMNSVRGPGVINADLGLFRKFQISERVDVQFRAEAFNISNTPHFSNPNGDANSAAFMTINSTRNTGREGIDERVFRLGIRVGF